MSAVSRLRTNTLIRASEITHRTFILPLLIFYPTGRCNSRCLSCDWWKSTGEGELSFEDAHHVDGTPRVADDPDEVKTF